MHQIGDPRSQATPHPTTKSDVTIVFTDIEASTRKVEELGNRHWVSLLAVHHGIVRRRVTEHGGTEQCALGDGFLLTFTTVEAGLRCVEAIQRDIASFAASYPDLAIFVRVGVHTGTVIFAPDGSLAGRDVHLASRVAAAAGGGEILLSDPAAASSDATPIAGFGRSRLTVLRGLEGQHLLHAANWR